MSSIDGTTTDKEWTEEIRSRYNADRTSSVLLSEAEMYEVLERRMRDLQDTDPKDPLFQDVLQKCSEVREVISALKKPPKKAPAKKKAAKKPAGQAKKKKKKTRRRATIPPTPSEQETGSVLETAEQKR